MTSSLHSMPPLSALQSQIKESVHLQGTVTRLLKLTSVMGMTIIGLIAICVVLAGLLLARPVHNNYFLLDTEGRIIGGAEPMTARLETPTKVKSMADECIKASFNISFVRWREELASIDHCFTKRGYEELIRQLQQKGILAELQSDGRIGSIVPRQANLITATPGQRGRPTWEVKGYYTLSLYVGKKATNYPLTIETRVVEVPMSESVQGMLIDSMSVTKG